MSQRASSTNAIGHHNTGIGTHNRNWVHYKAPSGTPASGAVFTQFDYDVADIAIRAARALRTRGSVSIASTRHVCTISYKCSNCQATLIQQSLPGRNGCTSRSGEHNWRQGATWTVQGTPQATLYYEEQGQGFQVSMHVI